MATTQPCSIIIQTEKNSIFVNHNETPVQPVATCTGDVEIRSFKHSPSVNRDTCTYTICCQSVPYSFLDCRIVTDAQSFLYYDTEKIGILGIVVCVRLVVVYRPVEN